MSKRRRQLVDLGGDENEGGGPAGGGAAIGFNYDSEDPIAAAIARRAAKEKKCALGGLLGAYVDDDDEEEEEETDGASKEPPHPWKQLRDATTGHDYYWNQDDGSVSWTLPSAGDATKAAERDSGDAGDDAPVAELKIPIPKPDVRTFADLLLSQADEVSGLREAIDETPALVRLVMDIERRVDDYERIKSGGDAETVSSAQDAALDALREAEKALPGAAEAFKARRAKAAAAEVARRVAAARAAKPASTKGKLAGVGRGAGTDVGRTPAAAAGRGRGRTPAAAAQARHRRGARHQGDIRSVLNRIDLPGARTPRSRLLPPRGSCLSVRPRPRLTGGTGPPLRGRLRSVGRRRRERRR